MRVCMAVLMMLALVGCKRANQTLPAPATSPSVTVTVPESSTLVPVATTDPAPLPVSPTPEPSKGIKRAVLVGINKYKDPNVSTLSGCVNDALAIKAKAKSSWGFKDENIVMLLDEQATVSRVKEALTNAVSATKTGDSLLYWHSSHGTEDAATADAAGEPDGLNQLVCCYDFAWDRAHELIDKDYVKIFSALPDGVYFNWASDSCHSGDLSRSLKRTSKAVRPGVLKQVKQPEYVLERIAKAKARGLQSRGIVGGLLDVGYISGCKSNQLSMDTQDEHGVAGGAMTIYFLKLVDDHKDKPISALASEMVLRLSRDGYTQSPEAEGARRDAPWLK